MSFRNATSRCLTVLMVSLIAAVPARVQTHTDHEIKRLTMKMEQVQKRIYALQALQVRITITNNTSETIGPLPHLDEALAFSITDPKGQTKRLTVENIPLYPRPKMWICFHDGPPRKRYNQTVPLFLKPGQSSSLLVAFSGLWSTSAEGPGVDCQPFFQEPGQYLIEAAYSSSQKARLQILVQAPPENDLFYQCMRVDQDLLLAVLSPVECPSEEATNQLKRLLARNTQSPYYLYAQLALVRAYCEGKGLDTRSRRVALATIGDILEAIIQQAHADQTVPGPSETFPYAPYALVLDVQYDPLYWSQSLAYLWDYYFDSLVWIEYFAQGCKTRVPRQSIDEILERELKIPACNPLACPRGDARAYYLEAYRSFRVRDTSK